ncbi:unnamed protein product [Brachionus calyciflorus]|uniref:Uncharacterized protein n=1 Tax=Brachionus calyciflorus TaxID=104777 RepID=A0A813T552_9BILA|nr:unnamed protein product [Brachionus calyciflorus]
METKFSECLKTISGSIDSENYFTLAFNLSDDQKILSKRAEKIDQSEIDTLVKTRGQINAMSDILDSQNEFRPKEMVLNDTKNFVIDEQLAELEKMVSSVERKKSNINRANQIDQKSVKYTDEVLVYHKHKY